MNLFEGKVVVNVYQAGNKWKVRKTDTYRNGGGGGGGGGVKVNVLQWNMTQL